MSVIYCLPIQITEDNQNYIEYNTVSSLADYNNQDTATATTATITTANTSATERIWYNTATVLVNNTIYECRFL